MKKQISLYNKQNNIVKCDVLIEFKYDERNYIVYTDNTIDNDGMFNIYKGCINPNNQISDPEDVDVDEIFKILINDYKMKVLKGEI